MSKLNISFNDKSFSIDESALADAKSELKQHLSTALNGTGATIELDGVVYSVDASKLAAAENNFAAYLNTIGTDAPADDDQLEGSGAEYYTLAPTALSFRSTAPLDEFQEVQVNGETVDPSNYTLEEGSTIVKLSIDYLKTLDVGNYDIAVKSNSKTATGDFTVAAPELNEYGFYYNQPYAAYVDAFACDIVLMLSEKETFRFIQINDGSMTTGAYSISGNQLTFYLDGLIVTGVFSSEGNELYINELYTSFSLGSEHIVADSDYLYIKVTDEDRVYYKVVSILDNTKYEYPLIRTTINDLSTLVIDSRAFGRCSNVKHIAIPYGIETIKEEAFFSCENLKTITLPSSVLTIEKLAFSECYNIVDIDVAVDNPRYESLNGDLYAKTLGGGQSTLIKYAVGKDDTSFVTPRLSSAIDVAAFAGCKNLINVTINARYIRTAAFSWCENLTSLTLSRDIESIGYSFAGCYSLANITFLGTVSEWNQMQIDKDWHYDVPATHVTCLDGQVAL